MMSVLVYGAETKTWAKAYTESTFTTGLSTAHLEASSVIMQQHSHLLYNKQSRIKNSLCFSRLTAAQIFISGFGEKINERMRNEKEEVEFEASIIRTS
jgi:hypothetical protein